jgi:hypothetical protein
MSSSNGAAAEFDPAAPARDAGLNRLYIEECLYRLR